MVYPFGDILANLMNIIDYFTDLEDPTSMISQFLKDSFT